MTKRLEEVRYHPAAAIFPLLTGGNLDELVASIRAHGLQESIKLHDGQVLDGRNRLAASRAPAHAIKKLLCCGTRGKGDAVADLTGAIAAINRAIELEKGRTAECNSSTQ